MSVALPPILVVDDEKNMRLSLKNILTDESYGARVVESAEEAMVLLGQEEFLLVVTDAQLGGMTGYEFIKQTKNRWPDIPLVAPSVIACSWITPRCARKRLSHTNWSKSLATHRR